MRRDKKLAILLIFMAFAIAGILQATRSTNKEYNLPYLATLEKNLNVLDEKCTSELNTYAGLDIDGNIVPVGYFVEEQGIIEEFTDQKQTESIDNSKESNGLISLKNDTNVGIDPNFRIDISKLQTLEAAARETKIYLENQQAKTSIKSNQVTHKIKANDNLYNLAKKYYNDQSKWTMIYQANKNQMSDPNSLSIGQELLIPDITLSKDSKQKQSQDQILLVHKNVL